MEDREAAVALLSAGGFPVDAPYTLLGIFNLPAVSHAGKSLKTAAESSIR
jgi:hypothetical protein